MNKSLPAVMGLCLLLGLTISLQAASAPTAAEKRRQAIEAQLKSGKVDQVNLGYADMLKWFDENIADAESSFWFDRVAIVGVPAHAQETLALIERSKEYKKKVAMLRDIGYLYAMQAAMLYQMDRSADAMAALQEGLRVDPNATTTESLSYLPRILTARKAFTELADALDALVTGRPQDAASVESTLKQRIALFNQLGKFDAALADAKRLFDVSTMDHTRDAITVLDKQLTVSHIADPSVVSAFRKEQTEGAVERDGAHRTIHRESILRVSDQCQRNRVP